MSRDEAIKSASIYFSEVPDRVKAREIFGLFGCIGEIVEVVIPPKRNKLGKRFGFARFKDVEDVRRLAVKLDNVFIDGTKIHANPPRFERNNNGEVDLGREKGKDNVQAHLQRRNIRGENSFVDARSFADVAAYQKKECVMKEAKVDLEFVSDPEVSVRLSKAYTSKVVNPGMTYNIQTCFELEGYFSIKVTSLGANLCLLEEVKEGDIEALIREGEVCWKQWFSEIRKWKAEDIDEERVTWLRVFGVPCQAWSFEFFELLANRVGSYICAYEQTLKAINMDVERFMVRTWCSRVLNEVVKVHIDGVLFKIKIVEDLHGPIRINLNSKGSNPEQRVEDFSDSEKSWNCEDEAFEEREEIDGFSEDSTVGNKKLVGLEIEKSVSMEAQLMDEVNK
ncbi:uncharacterized protein LOC131649870 [Vicia villosa]|uniref:uncharacterized protein LOC131649870 n=1 Tax=Vicia villosa TaxID=3911 RepID=UPI00273B0153|nr:uncharacterized protein LOC131649870 [Vicia villosa]